MKLSIIIPCFNESKTLVKIIERIILTKIDDLKKEIIIVDDGSGSETQNILKKIKKEYPKIKIVFHEKNMGKSMALRTGFKLVTGDIVLIQDADLEYNPADYFRLLEPIISKRVDVIYGSRFLKFKINNLTDNRQFVVNRFLTSFSNLFTRFKLTDMETGYKVFTKKTLDQICDQLISRRFGFEPEFTARISKIKSIRVGEIGISYTPRTYKEGKHINLIDGIKTIFQIVWYNLFVY